MAISSDRVGSFPWKYQRTFASAVKLEWSTLFALSCCRTTLLSESVTSDEEKFDVLRPLNHEISVPSLFWKASHTIYDIPVKIWHTMKNHLNSGFSSYQIYQAVQSCGSENMKKNIYNKRIIIKKLKMIDYIHIIMF